MQSWIRSRANERQTRTFARFHYCERRASTGRIFEALQEVIEGGKAAFVLTRDGLGFLDRFRALFAGTRMVEVRSYKYSRDF